jgi:hypothetical protein
VESLLIPMMVFAIPLLAIWTAHQRKMKTLEAQTNPRLEQEIAALRERVEVLERIVIEGNSGLAGKFKELENS